MNYKHGKSNSRTYKSWESMKSRCLNPNDKSFYLYGAKGVKICKRWLKSFSEFLKDMGDRPEGHHLDRKSSYGNYYKKNTQWATSKSQSPRRKRTRTSATTTWNTND